MQTAWCHLPNASRIDQVLAHATANPKEWVAAWDAARDAAREAAPDAVAGAENEPLVGRGAEQPFVHVWRPAAAWASERDEAPTVSPRHSTAAGSHGSKAHVPQADARAQSTWRMSSSNVWL